MDLSGYEARPRAQKCWLDSPAHPRNRAQELEFRKRRHNVRSTDEQKPGTRAAQYLFRAVHYVRTSTGHQQS